jgi:hypothetical protein
VVIGIGLYPQLVLHRTEKATVAKIERAKAAQP